MFGDFRFTRYQIDGADAARCGSLASRGFPEAVCLPLTTQLLLAASASAYRPTRSSAAASISCDFATSSISGFETDPGFLEKLIEARLLFVSFPTTSTSIGEISGINAARFSAGRLASASRITSRRHVEDNASEKSLVGRRESAAVHGCGWYPRIRNSGGRDFASRELM